MIRKMYLVLLALLFPIFITAPVFADSPPVPDPQPLVEILNDPDVNKLTNNDFYSETGTFSFTKVINILLLPLLSLAGLVLFAMIIWSGFQMLTAGGDAKKTEAGKTRLTNAVLGFLIIFAAYWITQIIEIILGVSILK